MNTCQLVWSRFRANWAEIVAQSSQNTESQALRRNDFCNTRPVKATGCNSAEHS